MKLEITQMTEEGSVDTYTEAISISHNRVWDPPVVPPDFTASMEASEQDYLLKGTFSDFLPSTVRVRPMYSLDGETYQVIFEEEPYDWQLYRLGIDDESEFKRLSHQICAGANVCAVSVPFRAEGGVFQSKCLRKHLTKSCGINMRRKALL